MLRFILNFFLFGFLFYLIYVFFPDAFHTLASWADRLFAFFRDLYVQLIERYHEWREPANQAYRSLFVPGWIWLNRKF